MSGDRGVTPEYMRSWGKHTHGSPLYAHLVEVIADDSELLRVINLIPHTPQPNVLFAAVHFLLMDDPSAELASYYPSLTDQARTAGSVGEVFRDYVLEKEGEIVELGATRYTQTNECRRCVALLPGVMVSGLEKFHLIEIGASAGLNLAIDRYHYRWADGEWGPESSVELEFEVRGEVPRLRDVEVLSRTGLDLRPVDPLNTDDRRWLAALIWPEHHERRARLEEALDLVATLDIDLVAGNALETLGRALDQLPAGEPAVVMNSFSLNQLSSEERLVIEDIVDARRSVRPIHRVSMEILQPSDQWAAIKVAGTGKWSDLGQAHPHGEWVEFYARP